MCKLFLILFFLLSQISQAQDSILQGSDNNFFITKKISDKEKKFSHTSFSGCIVDKNGITWIATEMGLYRYEGTYITKVTDKRFPAIAKNRIVKLAKEDTTEDIIFVTYPESSIYAIRDNVIQKITYLKYPLQSVFSHDNLCILANSAFHKKVIQYLHNHTLLKYNSFGNISIVKSNDKIYAGSGSELFIFNKNGSTKAIRVPGTSYVLLQFDDAILAMSSKGVFLLNENQNKVIPIKHDGIIQNYLKQPLTDNINNLYLSNGNNFLNHNNGIYRLVFKNNKLSADFFIHELSNSTAFLSQYQDKDLYFLKNFLSDITFLQPLKFNTITVDESERDNCYAVVITDNNTWVSASGWLYNTATKNVKKTFRDYYNKNIIIPYKNSLHTVSLYSVSNNYLHDIKNEQKGNFYKPTSTMTGYTYFKNKLWMSQDNLLVYEKGTQFEIDTFFSKRIRDLSIIGIHAYNNQIVVLTTKGVYYYKPFKSLTPIKGLQNIYARYFKPIDKDSYWIGCYGDGLFLVYKNRAFKVTDLNQELTAVHAVEEDSKGNLWMSTNDGLLTIEKKAAIKNILNSKPVDFYIFTTDDGLPTNEFNGGGTNPSIHDKNGIIGFPSVKGFVWFDPKKVIKHHFNNTILIEKISVDEKDLNLENDSYSISSNAKIIDINISFAYYFNRENITVEYCFADESVWHKIKDNSFQIARTSCGKRKVLIRIHTHSFDSKYDVIKSIELDFKPKFTETFEFWMIIVFVLIALIYIGLQIGLRINKEREKLLKQKVEEKTLELQNTVSELALSKEEISKSLKEKELLLKEIHHRVKNNLQLVISLLNIQGRRNSYQTIEEFLEKGQTRIMAMVLIHESLYQSESIERLHVKEYIHNLLDSIIESFGFSKEDLGYTIEAEQIYFTLETSISFGLIINELIANILKHAFPDKRKGMIKIEVSQIDVNEFELVVIDNGVGFVKKNQNKKSFGLELIELLVNQLNGSINIENQQGTTTKINFSESYI